MRPPDRGDRGNQIAALRIRAKREGGPGPADERDAGAAEPAVGAMRVTGEQVRGDERSGVDAIDVDAASAMLGPAHR